MDQNLATVLSALLGCVGVIASAFFGYKATRSQKRLDQARCEMKEEAEALSFSDFLPEWNEIHQDLVRLFADTCIDRFVVLRAWNGELSPKWATAHFQFREGGQSPVNYIHFELDDDYVRRLREITQGHPIVFRVEDIEESAIKHVYQAEGVQHSAWFHLGTLRKGKSSLIEYCSFATHGDQEIDPATLSRCRAIVGRLKGLRSMPPTA